MSLKLTATIPARFGQMVTVAKSGGMFTHPQAAVDSILDASAAKPYTVLLYPGVYDDLGGAGDFPPGVDMRGSAGSIGGSTRDYINLVGVDRNACILRRAAAPGVLTGVIQACNHFYLGNLTVDSPATRHLHWDTSQGARLHVDGVTFFSSGGQGALSCGGEGGNRMVVTNCLFDGSYAGCHGGGVGNGSAFDMYIAGCQFNMPSSQVLGFDLTTALHPTRISIVGNTMRHFNVDPSFIGINMPTDTSKPVFLYTDMVTAVFQHVAANPDLFYNSFLRPNQRRYISSTITLEGDCVVYDFATDRVKTVAVANTAFPAVVAQQEAATGSATWLPALVAGAYASVKVKTATAVALGDTLVTSDTAGEATVNNAQTDLTRVLGWAVTTKAGAVAGRVNVRLNQIARW